MSNADIVRQGTFPPSRSVRYPTPGSTNPDVELWIADFTNFTNSYNNATNVTNLIPVKVKIKPPVIIDGQ